MLNKNLYFFTKLLLYLISSLIIFLLLERVDQAYKQYLLVSILVIFFIFLLASFWYSEKQYYSTFSRLIKDQYYQDKIKLISCPKCKGIQGAGSNYCKYCSEEWIICQLCLKPFEEGSSILISPCCGMGFHPAHFESSLREKGMCPNCKSIDVLMETNW